MSQSLRSIFIKVLLFAVFFAFDANGQSIQVNSVTPSPACAGSTVTISFTTTNGNGSPNRFTTTTIYTIYLSDAAGTNFTSQGTFTTPAVSYAGGNSGVTSGITHNFNLPAGLAGGSGYVVALSSTSPAFNGNTGAGGSPAFTVQAIPTIANAGSDIVGASTCGLTQVTLAANTPTVGTGQWSIISGAGGSFDSNTDPTTNFNGVAGTTYTLRWTISNGTCTPSTDDMLVSFNQNPTVANAGPDLTGASTCGVTQIAMAANTPTVGTGQWSIISGTGGSFNSNTNPTTIFNGVAGNTYTLRWTITNTPCAPSTDDVVVTFSIASTAPTGATADLNNVCPLTNVNLNVVGGSLGTGAQWEWYSGSCGGVAEGTGPSISVNPSVTTTYYVRAESVCGNTICESVTVIVDPGVLSGRPGGITGSIVVCDGLTGVQYSVQPANNATGYNWTVPAGASITSGAGTNIITVDFPNPYTNGSVCVVSENACGVVSASRCLTVTNVEDFTPNRINGPTNVCENTSGYTYTALKVRGATNYNWTVPTGMTIVGGAGTRTITVDAGPSVTPGPICVSVDNGCGTSLIYCKNVNINSTATPGGITGPSGVCANNTGVQYSVPPVSGASSYTWTSPTDFNIVGGQGTRIITIDVGAAPVSGDVCVVANFSCGTSIQRCLPVDINGVTAGPISGLANVCAGTTGVIYSVADVPDAISYNWSFPAGITQTGGGTTRTVTVDIGSGFEIGDICVTVTSPCGTSAPSCKTVKDFSQTLPGGISGPAVVCQGETGLLYSVQPVSGAISYNWILPPGITITAGAGTRFITVDVDNSFTIGDIGVRAVSACPSQSLIRWNSDITAIAPEYPGKISASADICQNTTVIFSVNDVDGADTYNWILPQGMSFTAGPPTDGSSVSVDIAAGFTQGELCVSTVSACGINGNLRCQTYNINLDVPSKIEGPEGVCPSATGIDYSVKLDDNAASYVWDVPTGWNITAGTGTNAITVDIPANFIQGQLRVHAVGSCGNTSGYRILDVSYVAGRPGQITGASAICTGNTYVYSVNPVDGANSYNWTLPAGVTFTAGPPTNTNSVSVDIGGSFAGGDICVSASTACGIPGDDRCLALSITPDAAGAISGPKAVCQGATSVEYSIDEIEGISNYVWSVPANVSIVSGQGTTTLTVDIGGSFVSGQLCVEAQNSCGDAGANSCLNLSLIPDDPTNITASANFCANSVGTLSVEAVSGADTYTWVLPAGLTLLYGQGTETVTVEISGAFSSGNVCVTALTECGNASGQFCQIIGLSPAGTPDEIIASETICAGSNVVFSVPVVEGAGSYTWSLPSGLNVVSGQGTATLLVAADPGFASGDVCVTAVSGCGEAGTQYCQNFSVSPATPGNIVAPATICPSGPNAILSVTEVAGASSYLWTMPTGLSIVSGQGSNVIVVSAGPSFTSGTVSVAAESDCAIQGTTKTKTISSSLNAPGAISAPGSVCAGATGLVFSVPVLSGAVSYDWTVPAEFTITSGNNTNSITVDVSGGFVSGQVCVAGVSECGISGTNRCKTFNNSPNTPGGITGITSGACNQTLQYSVPNANGATSYTWTAPAGASISSGQGTRFVMVDFTNSFTNGQLTVFSSNACGNSGIRTSPVITGAPDMPSLIGGTQNVCANQTGINYFVSAVFGASSYTWSVPAGANITAGQGTSSITVDWGTTAGDVSVTANNTCGSSNASNLAVAVVCRIASAGIQEQSSLIVYPNPASEFITIQFSSEIDANYSFELFDLSGRSVKKLINHTAAGTNSVEMSISEIPAGVYILNVNGSDNTNSKVRVVIQ